MLDYAEDRVKLRALKDWLRRSSLRFNNLAKRSQITATGGPTVSMTTYGQRLRTCHLVVESLARGALRPGRVILWLTDDDVARARGSRALQRLVRRGLEIRRCADYGPHKKYFPYISEFGTADPLIIIDDDVIFPRSWLLHLAELASAHPRDVVAYRARRMALQPDGRPAPYSTWPVATQAGPSQLLVATGVSGVCHPPQVLEEARRRGTLFSQIAPFQDDLWLHALCLSTGTSTRLVNGFSQHFSLIPQSQQESLEKRNTTGGGNDVAIENVYSPADLARLKTVSNHG